jgi:RNA recognition motif-containing protein
MTKLFVGNLPFSASESDVRALFEQHGTIESLALINDRETGRPRGFGFIEMSSAIRPQPIEKLNGYQMDGRAIKVNEAQARSDAPRGRSNGGGGRALVSSTQTVETHEGGPQRGPPFLCFAGVAESSLSCLDSCGSHWLSRMSGRVRHA